MSEVLAQLEKKGGMSEKTLWTNSAPTSNFDVTQITLLEDMDNFDYIKIKWKLSTSNTSERIALFPIATIKAGSSANYAVRFGTDYVRVCVYNSNTSVSLGRAYLINSTTTSVIHAIPLEITGIKV